MFTAMVQTSAAYIFRGSPMFSPSLKAVVGEAGVAMRSQSSKAAANSARRDFWNSFALL